jgi:hypothetical protein
MASAEECREALQTLTARLAEMSPQDRASYFGKRSMSCMVTDLGVTFITRFANIARMWLSGRVKVQASMRDLLALRRLL